MCAAEARLVVDEQVRGHLLHLVHSLAALAARVVIRITLAATTTADEDHRLAIWLREPRNI